MSQENENTTYFGLTAKPRPIIALMIPLLALLLQWILWPSIQPYVWYLFYPVIFLSSWIGGKRAGLAATVLSALIVWWFFIPPHYSFAIEQPAIALTIIVFICMGILFSLTHDSLRKASLQASEAMAALRDAKHQLEDRVKARTTELETISESLKDSENRFRSVMENIPSVAVQGYSIDGTVAFWNKASEKLYGYSSEEAMGGNLLDLIIPPDMRSGVKDAINQMKISGEPIPPGELLLRRYFPAMPLSKVLTGKMKCSAWISI
jgi:PAS domain-containing protein